MANGGGVKVLGNGVRWVGGRFAGLIFVGFFWVIVPFGVGIRYFLTDGNEMFAEEFHTFKKNQPDSELLTIVR